MIIKDEKLYEEILDNNNKCNNFFKNHFKRYFVLISWIVMAMGVYFSYDLPGSLQNHIMDQFQVGPYEFSYLYSVYSWPNCFMCFVNGFLIDRFFGVKFGMIVFLSVATLGQLVFMIGGLTTQFYVLLVGRFIFGIGSEASAVCLYSYAVLWFKGKELNMVFAILLNIGRIGSSIVFSVAQPTFNALSNINSINRVLPNTISLLASVIFIPLLLSILIYFLKPDDENDREKDLDISKKSVDELVTKWSDFTSFPVLFWLLAVYGSVIISCVLSFLSQSQALFTSKFHVSIAVANSYSSFFSFFGAFLSPCVGLCIDKFGRNLSYIVVSWIGSVLAYSCIGFSNVSSFLTMFFLAVSCSTVYSTNWGLYYFIIPEHQIGTAFGIAQAFINITLSVGTVVIGLIANDYGYTTMTASLLGVVAVSSIIVIWSWILDYKGNGLLNMAANHRKQYMQSRLSIKDKESLAGNLHRDSFVDK